MSQPDKPIDAAKVEAAKQAVIFGFAIVTTIVAVLVERDARDPDAGRTARMWFYLEAKRLARWQADWWERIADKMATNYNREKA